MRIALVFPLLVACGGGGPDHWNKQPLETQEGTNDGVTFTIQLPKGMQKSKVESKYSVEWAYHVDGRTYAPSVSVSKASKKHTLAEAIEGEKKITKDLEVVWKEETPTSWAFAYENSSYKGKSDFIITGETTTGEVTMSCHARVYPMKKGGDAKGDIPAVAKMCASIKPK
jgi:hypothetical protein